MIIHDITIKFVNSKTSGRYKGRRARRQAFYSGQKVARLFTKIMRSAWTEDDQVRYEKAMMASISGGIGYFAYTPENHGHKFKGLEADAMWMDEADDTPSSAVIAENQSQREVGKSPKKGD